MFFYMINNYGKSTNNSKNLFVVVFISKTPKSPTTTPSDLILICIVSLFAQDKFPHILAVKLSPTVNPLAGTIKLPTPGPIREV